MIEVLVEKKVGKLVSYRNKSSETGAGVHHLKTSKKLDPHVVGRVIKVHWGMAKLFASVQSHENSSI